MYAPLQTPPFIQTVHGIWHPVTIGSITGEPAGSGSGVATAGSPVGTVAAGAVRPSAAQSVGGSVRN